MRQLGTHCIWCKGSTERTDRSHVLPECFGNTEHVLPRGIVCFSCNHYFGDKIEPALFDDAVFHTMCVMFQIVDPGDGKIFRERLFDRHAIPRERPQLITPKLDLTVRRDAFALNVECEELGVKEIRHQEYNRRRVASFSRAIHKVAFECLVYHQMTSEPNIPGLDLFAEPFEPIRQWARYGQPPGKVRPLGRMVATPITPQWQPFFRQFDQHLAVELRLYADWFAVSLTSPHDQVQEHLGQWYSGNAERIWLIANSYGPLTAGSGAPA